MFLKPAKAFVLVSAASGAGYCCLDADIKADVNSQIGSLYEQAAKGLTGEREPIELGGDVLDEDGNLKPQLTGVDTHTLAEVLWFGVTPDWVTQRWTRVTTLTSADRFTGMRVPLVTGTSRQDLAGTLTYYFDSNTNQLQRLTFDGVTGDASGLIEVLQRHGFQRVQSWGAELYLVAWNGQPKSGLRIQTAPVIRADRPLSRLSVQLEINRPATYYQMSPEFLTTVQNDLRPPR